LIGYDSFESDWIRVWEVFSRLGFCTVMVDIGKTCL